MLRIFTSLLAVLFVAAPAAAAEFKLLQPPENGIVRDREVHIVADFPVSPSAILSIAVTFDNLAVPYRLKALGGKTYLHAVTTTASLGAHNLAILVEGTDGSAKLSRHIILWKKNARFEISDPLSLQSPNGFAAKPFHDGKPSGCNDAKCHDMTLAKDLKVEKGKGCRACHQREGDWRHAPIRTGECALCHAGEKEAFAPTKTAEETCFTCHADIKSRLKGAKYMHGPVNKMVCELCHDPHGSREQMLTWRGKNDACVTCHAGYDKMPHVVAGFATYGAKGHPIAKVANKMEAGDEFSCGACHNPHGAETPYFFAYGAKLQNDLCRNCHDEKF
jgi:predicted CXXCH cytochrome family protein